jgi:hypothetical protein
VSIKQILDESRITVPRYPISGGQTGPRETCALSAITRSGALTAPDFYSEEKGQMRSMLIKALGLALKQDPKLDREAMIDAPTPERPRGFANQCRRVRSRRRAGMALNYMGDILMRSYQATLRKRQKAA